MTPQKQNIIGFIHLVAMMAFSAYGFIAITPSEFSDTAYIAIISSTTLSWIMLRDECLISYYVKKRADPAYVLGTNPESEDMSDLFPQKWQYSVIVFASHLSKMASLYVVVNRCMNDKYMIQQYPIVFYCSLYGVMVGYMVGYGFNIQRVRQKMIFRVGMGIGVSCIMLFILDPLFYLSLVFGLSMVLIISWSDRTNWL
jgi:hypothetical protein